MKERKPFRCALIVGVSLFLFAATSSCTSSTSEKKVAQAIQKEEFQDGDIIFHTSESRQCEAVQKATHSPYSHCGIIFKDNGQWMVYEAIQPVVKTPLKKWIARGKDSKYVVKRLKDSESLLSSEKISGMKNYCNALLGKNYDIYFEWDNDRIYCSELVWKAYKEVTDIEVGKLQHLKDFDLSSDIVRTIMRERYGDNVPYEELVISPAAVFESPLLEAVN